MKNKTRIFCFFILLEGAMVMALELSAAKITEATFGTSLHTWITTIGVSLISLTAGYFLGGLIVDKYKQVAKLLYRLMLLISAYVLFVPQVAKVFIAKVSAEEDILLNVLSLSFLLLFIPLLLLGMLPPIIIKWLSASAFSSGKIAGRVYALSTIGGIASTFLMGFYIIPVFGITAPLIVSAVIFSLLPFFFLASKNLLYIFYIALIFISIYTVKEKNIFSQYKLVHYSEGILGQLMVVDVPVKRHSEKISYNRLLLLNRIGQSIMSLETKKPLAAYINRILQVSAGLPAGSNILILGLGGGSLAKVLSEKGYEVDAVEIDKRMAQASREYFFLADDDADIYIDDARHFIKKINGRKGFQKYDLIILDVFKGEAPPAHLLTLEAFEEMKKAISAEGFLIINFNGFLTSEEGKGGRSLLKTLKAAEMDVALLPTPGPEQFRNLLFIAAPEKSNWRKRIAEYKPEIKDEFLKVTPDLTEDALVLKDDKPLLEFINAKAANQWRKLTIKSYVEGVETKGLPLFR